MLVNREPLERREAKDDPERRVKLEIKVMTVPEVPLENRENKASKDWLEAVGLKESRVIVVNLEPLDPQGQLV